MPMCVTSINIFVLLLLCAFGNKTPGTGGEAYWEHFTYYLMFSLKIIDQRTHFLKADMNFNDDGQILEKNKTF